MCLLFAISTLFAKLCTCLSTAWLARCCALPLRLTAASLMLDWVGRSVGPANYKHVRHKTPLLYVVFLSEMFTANSSVRANRRFRSFQSSYPAIQNRLSLQWKAMEMDILPLCFYSIKLVDASRGDTKVTPLYACGPHPTSVTVDK
ncbi:hypothetical protein SKAU_G00280220 [Synaphobranchus kaupii]|uniref:Secreted protein n=1 Tax=Synaphobranchus kaupii TaxID=118154 RepID=A0A9Q1EWY3_SYNKA|nr:hypothetical protein SKAU_G00280220 [Synaphobranchus kaupii]